MIRAMLQEPLEKGSVKCHLCAHTCTIAPSRRGLCGVRENIEGTLMSLVYARLISTNVDPIEKKPLFHFLPGSRSFSIATVGCNLRCQHCQNFEISQWPHTYQNQPVPGTLTTAEEIVATALKTASASISYTYTEPTIAMEFYSEVATLARTRGIKNVFVSNGFMSPESGELASAWLDANNIDLKGDDQFYRQVCGARLAPVQDTIRLMKARGVWVEVTTLLIPGLNDSEAQLDQIAEFLASVDPYMPWHISRFYPTYKLTDRPPTPMQSLEKARQAGQRAGLKYIYNGNTPGRGGEDTLCPSCGTTLVKREGYTILRNDLKGPDCPNCGQIQLGVW